MGGPGGARGGARCPVLEKTLFKILYFFRFAPEFVGGAGCPALEGIPIKTIYFFRFALEFVGGPGSVGGRGVLHSREHQLK